MPQVSIIIPTYNQADWLGECLESVLDQSFTDWEAIVVNNYSADHTHAVVKGFGEARFKLVDFANQGIIAASRNEAARLATGEWLAFLDSDDLWLPNKLERCLAGLKEPTNLICHQALRFNQEGPLGLTKPVHSRQMDYKVMLFEGNCLTPTTTLVKRDFFWKVGGFSTDEAWITVEDYDLWLKLAQVGIKAKILNEPLAKYRLHGANNSSRVERHFLAGMNLLEHHYQALTNPTPLEREGYIKAKARQYYGAARQYQAQGQRASALTHYRHSFRLNPCQAKLYLATLQTWLGR